MTVIFEDDDITILNRARSILHEVARRADMAAFDASPHAFGECS